MPQQDSKWLFYNFLRLRSYKLRPNSKIFQNGTTPAYKPASTQSAEHLQRVDKASGSLKIKMWTDFKGELPNNKESTFDLH